MGSMKTDRRKRTGRRAAALGAAACVLVLLALVGYGRWQKNQAAHTENGTQKETAQKKDSCTKLVVGIPFSGVDDADIDLVEAAVSEITEAKIGVSVEFVRTSSYTKQMKLMLSGNEQIDVLCCYGSLFIDSYVKGRLLALDDYLAQYGSGISEQVDSQFIDACRVNRTLYGIPTNRDYAMGSNAYMMRRDILEKYDIDPESIKSWSDLENVLATVRAGEPEMTVLVSGAGTMTNHLYFENRIGDFSLGVHMDYGRDEELENLTETDEYLAAIRRVRRWYLKGYLDPDVLGETEGLFDRVRAGEIFAYTTKGKPGIESQDNFSSGQDMVCVQLGEDVISYNAVSSLVYCISTNTASAEKSMALLNLFYTDADIMNLLCYGVEGVHYERRADGFLTYVAGEHTNPFLAGSWKMPNQYITDIWEGNSATLWEEMRRFNREAIHSCDLGFNFDPSDVYTEYVNLEKIYEKYRVVLENGLVNPEEGIASLRRELQAGGIDSVLREEREQYERWKTYSTKVYE